MKCPIDKSDGQDFRQGVIVFHHCYSCPGVFFTKNDYMACLGAGRIRLDRTDAPTISADSAAAIVDRGCPGCDGYTMLARTVNSTTIGLCQKCRGVWLDAGELEAILDQYHRKHAAWDDEDDDEGNSAASWDVDIPDLDNDVGGALLEFVVDAPGSVGD